MVGGAGSNCRATYSAADDYRHGYERRIELQGIHAGCMVEPHSKCRVVSDGGNRRHLRRQHNVARRTLLIGYGARRGGATTTLLLVLPLVIAISFTLIADIDSPRGGVVRVNTENLTKLSQTLHASNLDRP